MNIKKRKILNRQLQFQEHFKLLRAKKFRNKCPLKLQRACLNSKTSYFKQQKYTLVFIFHCEIVLKKFNSIRDGKD